MAAKGKARQVRLPRTIAGLEAELEKHIAERDDALARETAVIAERDEALAQQTATAEVLGVINSSPGELAPVFDAMLEKAMRLCEASGGALRSYDGEAFHAPAMRGVPEAFAKATRIRRPHPETALGRIERGEHIVHIPDLTDPSEPAPHPESRREMVDLGGIRTALWVALRKDETLLGTFVLYRDKVQPFTDKQIRLVETFAAQAVIAMENARLITETREALEQQTATAEVLGVINSSPGDLAPVFEAILEKAHILCGAAHGVLVLRDGENCHAVGARGLPEAFAERLRRGFTVAGNPIAEPLLRGAPCVQFADLSQVDHPHTQAGASIAGLRTLVAIPLRKDGALLGWIVGARKEVRPFTDKQIALLQNFAAQAVIAIENARLITETREALEQQTATAEVLQVINASPGDLAPVFDAMLEKATSLCEAAFGFLDTYDGEFFHRIALRGATPEIAEFMTRTPHPVGPDNAHGRLLRGEPVVHIADITEDKAFRSGDPLRRALVELGGRTLLAVPLRKEGVFLGDFIIFRKEVRPFSGKQIALLENFAAQAVVAMENARLITETREALEQQTATAEVLGVINSSPGNLAPVFEAILEKAHSLCGADHGHLTMYDGNRFRAVASHNVPEAFDRKLRQPFWPGHDFAERMFAGERVIHIPDMAALTARPDDDIGRGGVEIAGIRTLLFVPLRNDGALLGYITAHREVVRPFTDKQIALLENFAAQAVVAMENARLITETREALEQQTATAEVLQVINSSPGDLTPVFDAILEKAHGLCDSAHGTLFLCDRDDYFRPAAMRGAPPIMAERLGRGFPGRETPASRPLLAGEPFVHIRDMQQLEHPLARTAAEAGVRTLLSVPLRKGDALLGMIVATRFEGRPFSEKQIALLQNFAAQAVIAMENARLLGELRQRTEEVAELNRGLEARVAEQVDELGRVGRLKRFLAPQLAELIVSQGDEKILESHRREIVVVFCDLRGYTAFTETAEPEEVLDFLREYHGALGPLVSQFEGTLDQFSGDGIMVFFNDPVPIPDPAERAVKMAVAMREAAGVLIAAWRERGRELGFGAGIAQGYATLGQIGFSERSGYTAIGTVCNVAARLCAEARDGQILLGQRVNVALKGSVATEQVGALALKGLTQPVVAYNVPLAATQLALRVIEGGPQSV